MSYDAAAAAAPARRASAPAAGKVIKSGRSKILYALDESHCLVELRPTLTSFTAGRHEEVPGTDRLRLDFYEMAADRLHRGGVPTAFVRRVDPSRYVAVLCSDPPFEVIVKNVATGSTLRKYPGLFPEGFRFPQPVVKFDYRVDPEDQPLPDDYLGALGYDPARYKSMALEANRCLQAWLAPRQLWDFCVVIGADAGGVLHVTSEVSPDGMRLRSAGGAPLDKDLFRAGRSGSDIVAAWAQLVSDLR